MGPGVPVPAGTSELGEDMVAETGLYLTAASVTLQGRSAVTWPHWASEWTPEPQREQIQKEETHSVDKLPGPRRILAGVPWGLWEQDAREDPALPAAERSQKLPGLPGRVLGAGSSALGLCKEEEAASEQAYGFPGNPSCRWSPGQSPGPTALGGPQHSGRLKDAQSPGVTLVTPALMVPLPFSYWSPHPTLSPGTSVTPLPGGPQHPRLPRTRTPLLLSPSEPGHPEACSSLGRPLPVTHPAPQPSRGVTPLALMPPGLGRSPRHPGSSSRHLHRV
ncbi:U1 small nuclear ribonucleoprotein C-1-like [Orycteropus afer afer]|uniref:U1 small nuclear ribonucleoprotein C-1-like n=1 Tax=Orycteropus afer afer TaxID=1230840 RepID=A0AC54ZCC9_ORYAF|nr:U1 small nuclear ribonucleoprotein C-1-like [Orycteropus afer afer]